MGTWPGALIPVMGVSIKFGHEGGDGTGVGPAQYEGTVRFEQWLRLVTPCHEEPAFLREFNLAQRTQSWTANRRCSNSYSCRLFDLRGVRTEHAGWAPFCRLMARTVSRAWSTPGRDRGLLSRYGRGAWSAMQRRGRKPSSSEISTAMTTGNDHRQCLPMAEDCSPGRPPAPPIAAITGRVRGPAWLPRRGRRTGSSLRRAAGRDACAWCPPSRERHEP